jgi:hypothetical protein
VGRNVKSTIGRNTLASTKLIIITFNMWTFFERRGAFLFLIKKEKIKKERVEE